MKALMTLAEAATHTPYSVAHLRRAVKATDPSFNLKAKRDTKGRILVTGPALLDWIARHEDA